MLVRVPVNVPYIFVPRSGTSENGKYILNGIEVPLRGTWFMWMRAGTRTRGKTIAFPLIRAYAEIPLRGMLHHNICFKYLLNTYDITRAALAVLQKSGNFYLNRRENLQILILLIRMIIECQYLFDENIIRGIVWYPM